MVRAVRRGAPLAHRSASSARVGAGGSITLSDAFSDGSLRPDNSATFARSPDGSLANFAMLSGLRSVDRALDAPSPAALLPAGRAPRGRASRGARPSPSLRRSRTCAGAAPVRPRAELCRGGRSAAPCYSGPCSAARPGIKPPPRSTAGGKTAGGPGRRRAILAAASSVSVGPRADGAQPTRLIRRAVPWPLRGRYASALGH